jgi:hypothetical protein
MFAIAGWRIARTKSRNSSSVCTFSAGHTAAPR